MDINNILNTPLFGISISIVAFFLGDALFRALKIDRLTPTLTRSFLIIIFLTVFNINIETFKIGGDVINAFIAPATIALAIPLYKNIEYLKKRLPAVLIGIVVGAMAGLITIIALGKIFNVDISIIKSLLPKSSTGAISLSIAEYNGGIIELTALFTILTGTVGTIVARPLFKALKIKDRIAKGVSLGATSHIIGINEAIKLGEQEGAFGSVGLSIAGIITVFLVPIFIKLFL